MRGKGQLKEKTKKIIKDKKALHSNSKEKKRKIFKRNQFKKINNCFRNPNKNIKKFSPYKKPIFKQTKQIMQYLTN